MPTTIIDDQCDLPIFASARARTDGPATSQRSAANVPRFARGHFLAILAALDAGPAGQTEIADRAEMTVAAVSKRLSELRRGGLIEIIGECRNRNGGRESRYRRAAIDTPVTTSVAGTFGG